MAFIGCALNLSEEVWQFLAVVGDKLVPWRDKEPAERLRGSSV